MGEGGRPSARTVTLKRIEDDALLFTSALWTRKAREIEANPQVALLFHWPALGRQVHVTGAASLAERALAEELFAERDLFHQLQTVVSRQGEPIDDLDELRDRSRTWPRSRRRRRPARGLGRAAGAAARSSSSGAKPTTASTSGAYTVAKGPDWELTLLAPSPAGSKLNTSAAPQGNLSELRRVPRLRRHRPGEARRRQAR